MPSSQPQRSTYRDRRINVMLQENAAEAIGSGKATAEPEKQRSSTGKTSRRATLGIGLGTAGLCALAVFFLLFRHDTTRSMTNVPTQPVRTAPQSTPTPVAKPPAEEVAPVQPAPPPPQTEVATPARVQFRLSRSNRAQTVGSLNIRLMSTNARKGICSILIAAANSRPNQYTLQVSRPMKIALESGSTISLLVTGISKASVSGYVTGS